MGFTSNLRGRIFLKSDGHGRVGKGRHLPQIYGDLPGQIPQTCRANERRGKTVTGFSALTFYNRDRFFKHDSLQPCRFYKSEGRPRYADGPRRKLHTFPLSFARICAARAAKMRAKSSQKQDDVRAFFVQNAFHRENRKQAGGPIFSVASACLTEKQRSVIFIRSAVF